MIVIKEKNASIAREAATLPDFDVAFDSPILMSSAPPERDVWKKAVDEMLGWMSSPSQFADEDRPTAEILRAAMDYAADQMSSVGADAPDSIIPSGSGRIAMEWNDGSATGVLEFKSLGVAEYTRFDQGKVTKRTIVFRSPASNKWEIRD
jgi:hypothetical protein